MAAVGGSIESISIAGREFAVAADADVSRKLGGFENELQANGNGTVRVVKTRVPWSLSDVTVQVDDAAGDLEFLQNIANGRQLVPCAITFANGETYGGSGIVTGEVTASSQNATASITIMGEGTLTKQ